MKIHSIKVDAENVFLKQAMLDEIIPNAKERRSLYYINEQKLPYYSDKVVGEYQRLIRRITECK